MNNPDNLKLITQLSEIVNRFNEHKPFSNWAGIEPKKDNKTETRLS